MSWTHTVRKALKKLRYPSVDSGGNLLAQVTPRTGTLASLLAVSNAGDGEVATATDVDAQVVYKGDPSVGIPYFKSSQLWSAKMVGGFQTIPTATQQALAFTLASSYDNQGLFTSTTEITIPTLWNDLRDDGSSLTLQVVSDRILYAAGIAAGQPVTIGLQARRASDSVWVDVSKAIRNVDFITPNYTGFQPTAFSLDAFLSGGGSPSDRLRLTMEHGEAGGVSMVEIVTAFEVKFYRPA